MENILGQNHADLRQMNTELSSRVTHLHQELEDCKAWTIILAQNTLVYSMTELKSELKNITRFFVGQTFEFFIYSFVPQVFTISLKTLFQV